MTHLSVLLLEAGCLRPGLRLRACDRVFSDPASGLAVFFSLSGGQGRDVAWIDADPLGVPPAVVELPWHLTVDTLWAHCRGNAPRALPLGLRVAVNGVPWDGQPRALNHWDVVTVRQFSCGLFSLPLASLECRVRGITAMLVPQPGPTHATTVLHDGLSGDAPASLGTVGFNRENLHRHWLSLHVAWRVNLCLEGGYQQCVLVSADVPPFPFTAATLVAPEIAHVNMWFRTYLQRTFGAKFWQDAGLAYGPVTVMFDSALHDSGRCAWIFCIEEVMDVVIADLAGESLVSWPAPEGWVLRPVFTMGPVGQAALQLLDSDPRPLEYRTLPAAAAVGTISPRHDPLSDDEGFPVEVWSDAQEVSSDEGSIELTVPVPPSLNVDDDVDASDGIQLLQTAVCRAPPAEDGAPTAACIDSSGETRPRSALLVFGRRIATPCSKLRHTDPSESLPSGARNEKAVEQTHVIAEVAPVVEVQDGPVQINLADCLPVQAGTASRLMGSGTSIDLFLQTVQPLCLENLCQDFAFLEALHPVARSWLQGLPLWDRNETLAGLTLYTDGSFASTGEAAWAVVVTGRKPDGTFAFVGYVGDRLWPQGHALHVGQTKEDAHSAELVALLFAIAVVATQDNMSAHVVGDCTAALDVASARALSHSQENLATVILDLHLFAVQRGNDFSFQHVPSHEGVPGNECADSIAKHFSFQEHGRGELQDFCASVRLGRLTWLWWTATPFCHQFSLPGLDDDGCTLPDSHPTLPCFHACASLPGVPVQPDHTVRMAAVDAQWLVRAATYNCNSLKKEADRQVLDESLHDAGVHFAGMQETRYFAVQRAATKHYHCFCSRDQKGNLGCQIWVSSTLAVATREDACQVFCDPSRTTIVHSAERILAICVPAGGTLFGLVAAHAPISAASEEVRTQWWDDLRGVLRKLPRRAIPILLADCNARFQATGPEADTSTATAINENGRAVQWLCEDFTLQSCNLFDGDGTRVVTWTSPYGVATQLDYVFMPPVIATGARTLGCPWLLSGQQDIDHRPLVVEAVWTSTATAPQSRRRWDVDKIRTDAGRQCLDHIFRTLPHVPWTYDVDDHLQIINNHIHSGLQQHFVATRCRPRQPHVSDLQWQAIRLRRHTRRLIRRSKVGRERDLLNSFLQAWSSVLSGRGCDPILRLRRRHRALLQETRLAMVIRSLSATLTRLSHRDCAEYTRKVFREARDRGAAALYGALRGVMKVGRRYKPPRVLPALCVDGQTLADPVDIQRALVSHFAEPEHGRPVSIQRATRQGAEGRHVCDLIALEQLPSISEIAQGFLALQDNKAPGASGIPAEVYRHCALGAALGHAPLFLKIAARQQWPLLWRGTLNAAIPKPSKDGSRLQSWRSIALAEAAFKGVGKALRKRLAIGLQRIATPGQHGSLPGEQIGLPAHHVQSYLHLAQKLGKSATVIFLDGRSAYYATIREFLFSHELDDPAHLQELISLLVPDESLHDEAVAALLGPGLLAQAQIGASLQDYLQGNLKATWFTMDVHDSTVQHTVSGTAPGSPLADLLYQFVQTRFMQGVMQDLRDQGLCVHLWAHADDVFPQGWADDVAVMLPMCDATDVVAQIQACIPVLDQHSRRMGVSLNYDSGKTEALISLRGKGCVAVKRSLLSTDEPSVPVYIPDGTAFRLRLVETYQHLGNVVTAGNACADDVRRKGQAADAVYQRLHRTLLRNPELQTAEKTLLVASLVQAKVKYGAGLWLPGSKSEERDVQSVLSRHWRQACRPICGHSTKFLTEEDVSTLLGVCTAEEVLRMERARQLCVVADAGPGFLWHCLLSHRSWLALALDAVACMQRSLGEPPLALEDFCADLTSIRSDVNRVRRLLRPYGKACISQRQRHCNDVQVRATRLAQFEKQGGVLLHVPDSNECLYQCGLCTMRFSSRASKAAHQSTVHGVKSHVSVASGSVCNVCGTEWWTTFRLREHLRRSPACLACYQHADLDAPAAFETTGNRAQRAWRPPMQVQGPVPWWATLRPELQTAAPAQQDVVHVDVPRDADGLQDLAASFVGTPWASWIPAAFRWVKGNGWDQAWLPSTHAMQGVMTVLHSIAERAVTGADVSSLHSPGVIATREGRVWYLAFN